MPSIDRLISEIQAERKTRNGTLERLIKELSAEPKEDWRDILSELGDRITDALLKQKPPIVNIEAKSKAPDVIVKPDVRVDVPEGPSHWEVDIERDANHRASKLILTATK